MYRMSFRAGDAMSIHSGQYFTTIDRDNDGWTANCAQEFGGGWWYNSRCHRANLNGAYGDDTFGKGINWQPWLGFNNSLPFSELKIKPL